MYGKKQPCTFLFLVYLGHCSFLAGIFLNMPEALPPTTPDLHILPVFSQCAEWLEEASTYMSYTEHFTAKNNGSFSIAGVPSGVSVM